LLKHGYGVLAVYMPHMCVLATTQPMTHDEMFDRLKPKTGSVMKFFLEPTAVSLNAVRDQYRDVAMIGLSGGGWTTTVYSAIDPKITLSIPIAGTIPLYLRYDGSIGDEE